MTSVEVMVGERSNSYPTQKRLWSGTACTKHLTPVELYAWLTTKLPIADERVQAVVVQREGGRESRADDLRRKLRRSHSLPTLNQLDGVVKENPFWYTVRAVGVVDGEAFNASVAFDTFASCSQLKQSLTTDIEVEEDRKCARLSDHLLLPSFHPYQPSCLLLTNSCLLDTIRLLLNGALPERRFSPCKSNALTDREKFELCRVVKDELAEFDKEDLCAQQFRSLVESDGVAALTVATLRAIAMRNNYVGGHWSIYAEKMTVGGDSVYGGDGRTMSSSGDLNVTTGSESSATNKSRDSSRIFWTAPDIWASLLQGFLWGALSTSRATSVSFKRTPDGRSFSIYNTRCMAIQKQLTQEDPIDDEVVGVMRAVRRCGYMGSMKYKPEVFTACQITHANQKVLRPTIYRSCFNKLTGRVEIHTDYTCGYTPEVSMGVHTRYEHMDQFRAPAVVSSQNRHRLSGGGYGRGRPSSGPALSAKNWPGRNGARE